MNEGEFPLKFLVHPSFPSFSLTHLCPPLLEFSIRLKLSRGVDQGVRV